MFLQIRPSRIWRAGEEDSNIRRLFTMDLGGDRGFALPHISGSESPVGNSRVAIPVQGIAVKKNERDCGYWGIHVSFLAYGLLLSWSRNVGVL
jgi:hypothetical protein